MKRLVMYGVAAAAVALASAGLVFAQPPEIKSKLLQHEAVSDAPGKEAFMLVVEFAPGATTGRHIHHGDEYATVVEGELQVNVEGQAPRIVKAGEAYHNSANVVHETKNIGTVPARLITTFVVDKDKPLSDPVK